MKAYLSLGTNEGDRISNLNGAIRLLRALDGVKVKKSSSAYRTEPVDVPFPEEDYFNIALQIETSLPLQRLLCEIHHIEEALGRIRGAVAHAPRPIDIDIIAYGDIQVSSPGLTVPHPEAAKRRFVMLPLAEISPGLVLPGETKSVSEILKGLPERPYVVPLTAKEPGQ